MRIYTITKNILIACLTLLFSNIFSQTERAAVTLTSTNLPIVFINTNGQRILNETDVIATMKIIDNGHNVTNKVTDPINSYNGEIDINTRGSWTLRYPQKSFSITTIDALGNDLNDTLLGMKSEHKWVLYAPYDERTFMLNPLTFKLARKMGQWAPRTRFCEVMLDTLGTGYQYHGVYVMMEKIKRDNNRVDISKLDLDDNAGDSLSGGYIIGIDSNINDKDSGFTTKNSPKVFIRYVYPKDDEITPQQKKYIKSYIDTVENSLLASNFADPDNGYRKYMDEQSFIDFFIIQELSKNLDGFKRSAYMYKDKFSKGGKLVAGPQWDFNSAWGNPGNNKGILGVCDYEKPEGWVYKNTTCWLHITFPVPFYWKRLHEDPAFVNHLKCRWLQLRQTYLSKDYINGQIDSMETYLTAASAREYKKYNFNYNYANSCDDLKSWISARIDWMDKNMPGDSICLPPPPVLSANLISANNNNVFTAYPNPVSNILNINMNLSENEYLTITLVDALGRNLIDLKGQNYTIGSHQLSVSTNMYASGIYYLKFQTKNSLSVKKIVISNP